MVKSLKIDEDDRLWYLTFLESRCREVQQQLECQQWEAAADFLFGIRGSAETFELGEFKTLGEEALKACHKEEFTVCDRSIKTIREKAAELRHTILTAVPEPSA